MSFTRLLCGIVILAVAFLAAIIVSPPVMLCLVGGICLALWLWQENKRSSDKLNLSVPSKPEGCIPETSCDHEGRTETEEVRTPPSYFGMLQIFFAGALRGVLFISAIGCTVAGLYMGQLLYVQEIPSPVLAGPMMDALESQHRIQQGNKEVPQIDPKEAEVRPKVEKLADEPLSLKWTQRIDEGFSDDAEAEKELGRLLRDIEVASRKAKDRDTDDDLYFRLLDDAEVNFRFKVPDAERPQEVRDRARAMRGLVESLEEFEALEKFPVGN